MNVTEKTWSNNKFSSVAPVEPLNSHHNFRGICVFGVTLCLCCMTILENIKECIFTCAKSFILFTYLRKNAANPQKLRAVLSKYSLGALDDSYSRP